MSMQPVKNTATEAVVKSLSSNLAGGNNLILDTGFLNFCCKKRFPGKRIDYTVLTNEIQNRFGLLNKIALVGDPSEEGPKKTITLLRELGYKVITKTGTQKKVKEYSYYELNWHVEMTLLLAAASKLENGSRLILGSCDPVYGPVIKELDMAHYIYIYGIGIPKSYPTERTELGHTHLC